MTDTAELIAELTDQAKHRVAQNSLLTFEQSAEGRAAVALAAQAQELTQERARNHAFMAAAEAAEASVRESEPPKQIGKLTHGMNCAALIPGHDEECTCGLKWRIYLQTEQTMHNAWRERAATAEAERDAIEAKTFTETRERCAQVADRIDSVNGIAAMIRALRHTGA